MYSRLNFKSIIDGHNDTLKGANGIIPWKEKLEFYIIPIIISLVIAYFKYINDEITNILTICLSVLIGLLLNLLVLILSNVQSKDQILDLSNRKNRLNLIEETFYNISFTILLSIMALIAILLMNMCLFDFKILVAPFITINIKFIIIYTFSVIIYFLNIKIFINLFMVLKRMTKVFKEDLGIEKQVIEELEKKRMDNI